MILSNNLSQKSHYEIIGVKEDASHEEIRKSYRSAILNYHPDKLQKPCETSDPEPELQNRFLEVQRAWETLADPRSRALYDCELRTMRQDAVTADDVSLEDMTIEDAGSCFELSYCCRCGDYFSVDSSELTEMGYRFFRNGSKISLQTPGSLPTSVILPCGSCSLKVRLHIDADITLQTEWSS
ncbi:DnaJsubfamily C member 21 [Sesamum alatum]|uniref:DnaJsubfamily C member 21 n=1 Tax=Sesamum alatum TaxID=300844 RepID=A0AAE2CTZ4_9LAMI|nr:DnaJsubfamily C member 21 [Sesamum alatum]